MKAFIFTENFKIGHYIVVMQNIGYSCETIEGSLACINVPF